MIFLFQRWDMLIPWMVTFPVFWGGQIGWLVGTRFRKGKVGSRANSQGGFWWLQVVNVL